MNHGRTKNTTNLRCYTHRRIALWSPQKLKIDPLPSLGLLPCFPAPAAVLVIIVVIVIISIIYFVHSVIGFLFPFYMKSDPVQEYAEDHPGLFIAAA